MGMLNKSDYTVGWICAIQTEYVAAQLFLEEEHGPPDGLSRHDSNDYTLGSIGHHNVVVAVLPNGGYGKSSAATVANNMLHSFPNVSIGLMVGIGGGVPSPRHDIRLGDVVVSSPSGGYSGVFQYDFGKSVQNQSFYATGFLNSPPTLLRTAVAGLEASYERKGHWIKENVASALTHNPRLRAKYSHPGRKSDILFASNCTHSRGKRNCQESCPASGIIRRKPRSAHQDDPVIHYGLIASGDTLMKDAMTRDRLAAERDVLCFEMEAAGLMNSFPCLVIRGICDYSDSHKNKDWQGYAAMTAAAYARDVLMRVSPISDEIETRAGRSVSSYDEPHQSFGTYNEEDPAAVFGEQNEELGEKDEHEGYPVVGAYSPENHQSMDPRYSATGNRATKNDENPVPRTERRGKKGKVDHHHQSKPEYMEAEDSRWSEWFWNEGDSYWYRARQNEEGKTEYEVAQGAPSSQPEP